MALVNTGWYSAAPAINQAALAPRIRASRRGASGAVVPVRQYRHQDQHAGQENGQQGQRELEQLPSQRAPSRHPGRRQGCLQRAGDGLAARALTRNSSARTNSWFVRIPLPGQRQHHVAAAEDQGPGAVEAIDYPAGWRARATPSRGRPASRNIYKTAVSRPRAR